MRLDAGQSLGQGKPVGRLMLLTWRHVRVVEGCPVRHRGTRLFVLETMVYSGRGENIIGRGAVGVEEGDVHAPVRATYRMKGGVG